MPVKIIVAVAQNGVIGAEGRIPWRLPDDLKRFSKLTKGDGSNAVIMGRKTWESIPAKYRPLPGRKNFVVSSRAQTGADYTVSSLWDALGLARGRGCEDIWLIGGQRIYEEAMAKYVDRTDELHIEQIHLTLVHHVVHGDTFFPHFDSVSDTAPFRPAISGYHEGDPPHTYMRFDRRT